MNLQGFEARHLAVLDMLFTERHVGRTAERLHLSQPAVSNSLAWLRRHFDDPLVVRSGGSLRLTPFAERLRQPVRQLLLDFRALALVRPHFDTSTATQHFRLTISQFAAEMLMRSLLRQIAAEAPSVTLECCPISGDVNAFDRGEIDLLVVPLDVLHTGHPREVLFADDWLCAASTSHLGGRTALSADAYGAARHVLPDVQQAIGWELEAHKVERDVAAIVPHSMVLPMIEGTPWVATMPRGLMRAHADCGLTIFPLPFDVGPLVIGMQWHRDADETPASIWLRGQVRRAARQAGLTIEEDRMPSLEDDDLHQE
jgi:DNA-binding transcriptional LysR family regulator